MNLIIFLLIGALAGWLAGVVMKGRGFGVLVNMVVGVLGAYFGGWLLPKFGIAFGGDTIENVRVQIGRTLTARTAFAARVMGTALIGHDHSYSPCHAWQSLSH